MRWLKPCWLLLTVLTILPGCGESDKVEPLCLVSEISYENLGSKSNSILFEYNSQNQLTLITNRNWENFEISYTGEHIKRVTWINLQTLDPGMYDTTWFEFSFLDQSLQVDRVLLRNGPDTLIERNEFTLDNSGRMTKRRVTNASGKLILRYEFVWKDGNMEQINGYDSLDRYVHQANYIFDAGKNPLKNLGVIFLEPVLTSQNNSRMESFAMPYSGYIHISNPQFPNDYNASGYPNTCLLPVLNSPPIMGTVHYKNCK